MPDGGENGHLMRSGPACRADFGCGSAIPRQEMPGFCRQMIRPHRDQRAWGMPGAQCTRSRACSVESTRVSHHESTGNHPAFPHANGFNGFFRALPGDRAFLSPSPAKAWLSQA